MDITTVLTYLKDLLATFMTLLMMMSPAFGGNGAAYTAKEPDKLVTSFVVLSDIHVETNQPKSYNNLKDILYGVKAGEDVDTVIYTGDNVMNGQVLETMFFYSAVRSVMPAENNYVVAGNHDLGNGEGDYSTLRANFIANSEIYLGEKIEKPYYYRVVDGCYMVCLVSEDPTSEDFMMSQEQFDWIKGVFAEAEGAPIFVFNHFPLRYLNGVKDDDAAYNDIDNTELDALFAEYGVKLYVHGHIHDDLDAYNFYTSPKGIKSINLPRCTEITEYEAGDGIVVEVYEGEVVVRGRDFIKGEWIEGLDYTYTY